jgi:hypothetical protein
MPITKPADFPLCQWFDLTEPISDEDRKFCEGELLLDAHKRGLELIGAECQATIQSLRAAVRNHNLTITSAAPAAPRCQSK